MTTTRTALEGETITLQDPRRREYPFTVRAACEEPAGHWACATHPGAHIAHNMAMGDHVAGPGAHVEVWVCHTHGPEAPR